MARSKHLYYIYLDTINPICLLSLAKLKRTAVVPLPTTGVGHHCVLPPCGSPPMPQPFLFQKWQHQPPEMKPPLRNQITIGVELVRSHLILLF